MTLYFIFCHVLWHPLWHLIGQGLRQTNWPSPASSEQHLTDSPWIKKASPAVNMGNLMWFLDSSRTNVNIKSSKSFYTGTNHCVWSSILKRTNHCYHYCSQRLPKHLMVPRSPTLKIIRPDKNTLVGGIPTPLKNMIRQLGWWNSQYMEK